MTLCAPPQKGKNAEPSIMPLYFFFLILQYCEVVLITSDRARKSRTRTANLTKISGVIKADQRIQRNARKYQKETNSLPEPRFQLAFSEKLSYMAS